MEKISIARRRWEQQKPLFSIKSDHVHTAQSDLAPSKPDQPTPSRMAHPLLSNLERYFHISLPDADSSLAHKGQLSVASLFGEKAGLRQAAGKQRFVVEIRGLDQPLKMVASLEMLDSSQPDQDFLTIEEAARICQVSKETIYRQLHRGILQGLKIGQRWRVLSNSLNKKTA
ncbi:MAG: helix-turn-helix domain-containing protein [bacterium]|nr:helix-turn-helix domain-containing protein [bacterium]